MWLTINISDGNSYHINRGFHKQIPGLVTYMIKILGIDCDDKDRQKQKKCLCDRPHDKFSANKNMFAPKKIKYKKRKRKQEELYEEVCEAV